MRFLAPSFIVLACAVLSSCARPFVRVAPSLQPSSALPTLMVSTVVEVEQSQGDEGDLLNTVAVAASDAVQNSEIDKVGVMVVPTVGPVLSARGVSLIEDKSRADALRKHDWTEFGNKLTVLSGTWIDPDGMVFRVSTDTLFRDRMFDRVAEALNSPTSPEGFAYVVVQVRKRTRWLVLQYPGVRLTVIVSDDKGEELLRARTYGEGKARFLYLDRSPENLVPALMQAADALKSMEPEPL